VCSTNARFMYPFSKLGFTPELGSSLMLPLIVGMAKAKQMMFLGDWLSAQEALSLGLANAVVPAADLMKETIALAERLVHLHPAALKHSKRILNMHLRNQLDASLEMEQATFVQCIKETGGPIQNRVWMDEQRERIDRIKSKL